MGADTGWLLWTTGMRGPEPSILWGAGTVAPALNEHERRCKIGDAIKLPSEDDGLGLKMLARLYPPPGTTGATDIKKAKKAEAIANDPGT